MKTLAVLSGNSGVGKNTITASLAVILGNKHTIVVADCDVDAPNLALVLGIKEENFQVVEHVQTSKRAKLIIEKCNTCKECLDTCNYSSLIWDHGKNSPIINNLCVGCGTCTVKCPENAIALESVENASIKIGETEYGFPIISGQLDTGESGSEKVVTAVKIWSSEIAETINAEFLIVNSAAGIGRPVITSLKGSDYVLLLTEPTPAAFWDLQRAIELVNDFDIPHGVIINKCNINKTFTKKIEEFFTRNNIPIIGEIPYNKKFVDAMVNLKPVVVFEPEFADIFLEILENWIL
jgi:MinD superfamily P-loop ATPase